MGLCLYMSWTEWRKLGKAQLEVLSGPILSLEQEKCMPKDFLPVDGGLGRFFVVIASGGLYSTIYINNSQSFNNHFCALDTTLRTLNT